MAFCPNISISNISPWPRYQPRLHEDPKGILSCRARQNPLTEKGTEKYSYLPSTNKAFDIISLGKETGSELMVKHMMLDTPTSPKNKYMVK